MKNKLLLLFTTLFVLSCLAGNKAPNNFKEIDLVINKNEIAIGGTLTVPNNLKIASLVIMSSGSGDQDRDETLAGFKIFKIIAEHLASKGIATFRYDDRGIGKSTGDFVNSTIHDLSQDLENIMDYFTHSKTNSFKSFMLFGHSQGGIVAAKVAVKSQAVKKVILMAVPAVPLYQVVLYQIRQEFKDSELSKLLLEANVAAHNKLMSALKNGSNIPAAYKNFKTITAAVLTKMNSNNMASSSQITQQATNKANEYKLLYALPSLQSFLYYNPAADFKQLRVPVLSLFGGMDFWVSIDQNKDIMEQALLQSGTDFRCITFEKANHFFQHAKTGSREELEQLEKSFVAGFLDSISHWILKAQ